MTMEAGEAVVVLDHGLRYLVAEGETRRALGLEPAKLLGKALGEVLGPDSEARWAPYYRAALGGKGFVTEEVVQGRTFVTHGFPLRFPDGTIASALAISLDVTERRRAEEVLRESEPRLSLIFARATVGISEATPQGVFLKSNPELHRILGRTPAQMEGLTIADITYPDDLAPTLKAVERALATGDAFPVEKRYLRPDGSLVWAQSTISRLNGVGGHEPRLLIVTVDLTARREAEAALRESEARARALAELGPTLLWETSASGRHVSLNRRWMEYTGQSFEETQDGGWRSAVHPEDRPVSERAFARAFATGNPLELEHRIRRHDGVFRWFLVRQMPIRDEEGKITRWLGAATDVDEQHEALWAAKRAKQEAERANRMKDEFLATLSHELRTPLAPILLWSRALLSGAVPISDLPRALEAIVQSAQSQSRLIEDLLDMSRIQANKLELVTQRTSPAAAALSALEVLRPEAEHKRVVLETEIEEGMGEARLDPDRLQQVFWNLLSNAVKFTPAGGRVLFHLHREKDELVAFVSDSGQGISADFLPQVFERFRQADGTESRRTGGLGIGLALCRRLVELHGGIIDARSDGPGQGAVFTVRIPWVRDEQMAETHPRASGPRGALDQGLRDRLVLLVEDDTATREVMRWTLERQGAEVLAVGSGPQALDAAKVAASEHHEPDAVVCDIGLPGMSGYEVIRELTTWRKARGQPPVPACAVSAHAREVDRQRAMDAGFERYLSKPVRAEALVSAVKELIGAG